MRGAGSEFVLACDMRFAARESAIFGQFEPAFGQLPGGGAAQHLPRLMGRARALEVMLSAEDYDAELAERYGWINRALPADALGDFVRSLAHRIARFPASGHVAVKERVNAIALAPAEDFRRDSDLFIEGVRSPEYQARMQAATERGFQTRDAEMNLARMLGDFVRSLAHRIASFPSAGHVAVKDRVNAIALAPAEDFRRDSDLFGEGVRTPEAQSRIQAAMERGFQTRDAEMALARMLGDLADH